MPFVLIVVGIILLVTAIQGTTGQLGSMLVQDTFGTGGYVYWFVAIIVIGAVGYVKQLKTLSDMGMFLVVLVLFLSHKGFFQQFNAEIGKIKSGGTAATGSALAPASAASDASSVATTPAAPATPANPVQSGAGAMFDWRSYIPGLPLLTGIQ